MLHLYRIYQLEEVIYENLRPEKIQDVQEVSGRRKKLCAPGNQVGEETGPSQVQVKRARKRRSRIDVSVQ